MDLSLTPWIVLGISSAYLLYELGQQVGRNRSRTIEIKISPSRATQLATTILFTEDDPIFDKLLSFIDAGKAQSACNLLQQERGLPSGIAARVVATVQEKRVEFEAKRG